MSRKWFVGLIPLFLKVALVSAQELSEIYLSKAPLEEPTIVTGVTDLFGIRHDSASALIIVSNLDRLAYKSNTQIIKKESRPGEDILYFSEKPTHPVLLEITKSGYKLLTINLTEKGALTKKKTAWGMEVQGIKLVKETGIRILSHPKADTIKLDDVDVTNEDGYVISQGFHTVILKKAGYVDKYDTIRVSETATVFEYNLKLPITIQTNLAEAIIYIDDNERVQSGKHAVVPGRHKILVAWPGYKTKVDSIQVSVAKRFFSYSLSPISPPRTKSTSGYSGGLKFDFHSKMLRFGRNMLQKGAGLGLAVDFPLIKPFLAIGYAGGGLGILQHEELKPSDTKYYYFAQAGAGLQLNILKNGNGIYAKGAYLYRAIFFSPLDSAANLSLSDYGYSAGGGLQLSPSKIASFRLEFLYHFLEFEEVNNKGRALKFAKGLDASGFTVSLYLQTNYLIYKAKK